MIATPIKTDSSTKLKLVTDNMSKSVRERNNAIIKAYNLIVDEIKLMLSKVLLDRKRKHFEVWYEYDENIANDELLREFVCMFCTVSLSISQGKCIIEFDTDQETEKQIGRIIYNALIRVAYKHTMQENTGYKTEGCLFIDLNKTSQYSYFINRQKEQDYLACLYDYEESLKSN